MLNLDMFQNPKNMKEALRKGQLWMTCYLVLAFYDFAMREMQSSLIGSKMSFKDAENMAGFLSSITKSNVSPNELIHTDDELSDGALKNHDEYMDICRLMERDIGISRKTIESVFRMLYHNPPKGMATFRMFATTTYQGFCTDLLCFALGDYPKEEMIRRFKEYDLSGKSFTPSKHKVRLFIKQMLTLQRLIIEVKAKQSLRKEKSEEVCVSQE